MPALLAIALCTGFSSGELPVPAQETTAAAAFRLVSAKSVDDLQQELDRASADGYAVALAWPAYELVILRRREVSEAPASYRVFNGEQAIKDGLTQGYRAVPDTLDVRQGALLVIAAKATSTDPYESLLLHTNRTGTLETEIRNARTRGYHVVGMTSDDAGHAALLERRPAQPPAESNGKAVALIAASAQDTLQKELAVRASAGYGIAQASSWKETVLALEHRGGGTPLEYRVLSTTKSSTLEREMNAAAANGFRLTPGTIHAQQKGAVPLFGGRLGTDYVAIMEKASGGDSAAEYVIVGARRIKTLVREFDEAVAKGLVPVALSLGYSDQETLVIFERPRQ